jgi:8-hydroxy-5-deazaflavin:NADPH oxidoreductase
MKKFLLPLVLALMPLSQAQGVEAPPAKTVKIGIIGTGDIGGALARHWAKAGYELLISSRHPEQLQALATELGPKVKVGTPREAAAFGDVVLVSVPYHATAQVGRDYATELKDKVVLDTGNPYPSRDGEMAVRDRERGTGVASKEYLPGTKLVRAFNAINSGPLANEANRKPEKIGIPLASDHADALKVAAQLVTDAGFDPVVVGGLARAREFDYGTPVYVRSYSAAKIRELLKLKVN